MRNPVGFLLENRTLGERVEHHIAVCDGNLVLRASGPDRDALDCEVRFVARGPDAHRALLGAVEKPLPIVNPFRHGAPAVALHEILPLDLRAHAPLPCRKPGPSGSVETTSLFRKGSPAASRPRRPPCGSAGAGHAVERLVEGGRAARRHGRGRCRLRAFLRAVYVPAAGIIAGAEPPPQYVLLTPGSRITDWVSIGHLSARHPGSA